MSKRKTRRHKQVDVGGRCRPVLVIAIAVILSMFAACAMLPYTGAFSLAFRQKGAKRGKVSTATLNSNSPSKEYIYSGERLIATEEPISANVASPTMLFAKAYDNEHIQLTWTASAGSVDHYEIERGPNVDGPFGTVNSNYPANPLNPFTDSVSFASVTSYMYRVRAVDSGGNASSYSNIDFATTIIFTDDTPSLIAGVFVKAAHITELRAAVNAVRATKTGLSPATWSESLSPGITTIKAVHINELRTNLNEALNALSGQVPAAQNWFAQQFTDPTLNQYATVVKKEHIQELRDRVK